MKEANVPSGVHLAILNHIDEVIGQSIEVEEHPDRRKNDVRDNNDINPDALMHRFYGVAKVSGVDYGVMTLMREDVRQNIGNNVYIYETLKIKVLDEKSSNTSNGLDTPNSELEVYPLAKVIEDVGKTMEPDKLLLTESAKTTEKGSTPSLSPEEQERQTRTGNFKRWFGDWERDSVNASKVVDENGRPIIMSHNTDNEFYTFDRDRIGSGQGQAFLGMGPEPFGVGSSDAGCATARCASRNSCCIIAPNPSGLH